MSPKVQSLLLETMPKSLVQIKLNDMPLDFEDEFSPAVTRHEDYYFDDGNLVLRIENTLFRVFRSTFIRHSSTFSDLFDLPPPSQSKEVEGTTDYNPIILSGISVVDFERLLWVLYPPYV
ncbi:hypothetical protein QCA50_005405 [Cerrena zonata]|uniref:BTB domain-containing protein n=1 Tax=Cerrena zonata TaxID=2478898 RepID=A0AAW0GLM1_9APHY